MSGFHFFHIKLDVSQVISLLGDREKKNGALLQQQVHTHQSLQFSILTGGGSADWSRALRRAPSLHIVGTHSYKVMHSLHLEKHQTAKLSPCINLMNHPFRGKEITYRSHY